MSTRKIGLFVSLLLLALFMVGCGSSENTSNSSETSGSESTDGDKQQESNGEMKIAVSAQPPTLDAHVTTAIVAMEVSRNIFETLVALDEKLEAVPVLAESIEKSEDGKTYTFQLREGVKFHNGKEMTSEDVEASMNRWLEKSPIAATIGENAFEATDQYTVTLNLNEPVADVLDIMAGVGRGQYTAIMPKEIIESASAEGVSEFIGTGPYKFEEWKQDQYIHLVKNEEYQAVEEPASGLSGNKQALVDDLYYYIVTDDSTRLAGVQTGEYDVADNMPFDNYEQLKNDENLQTYAAFDGTLYLAYNKKEGVMSDAKMRQAVNAALDKEQILLASYANEDLFNLHPSYMNTDQEIWATDAGIESYNQKDPEKAKQLAEEAGYNGEEIILLTTRDYDHHFNAAVVIQELLTKAGFNVKLDVYDWATLLDRRNDPANWDLVTTATSYVTSPSQLLALDPSWGGWTSDPKITELLNQIGLSTTQEEAKGHWEALQSFLWNEYLPVSLIGHHGRIVTATKQVEGLVTFPGPIPWNTTVNK